MRLTRRITLFGLASFGLCGCVSGSSRVQPVAQTQYPAVANPDFDVWVTGFKARAEARGVTVATVDRAFRNAGYLPDVIDKDRHQTEFTRTLQDYLAIAGSDARIAMGQAGLAQYAGLFSAITARYDVDTPIIAAIWGLESFYGTRRGTVPVIAALATLAFDGRRGAFFESQLMAALRILDHGDVSPEAMTGSWAGAMGHTQFIPTTYLEFAVDFQGDGRRDIWGDDPTDALASTANYLAKAGWARGQPWGQEVAVPAGAAAHAGHSGSKTDWQNLGVTRADGGALADHGPGVLIMPEGGSGPAFLTYHNYSVIARYNNAQSYIIGVGYLADRLAGGPALRFAFPPDGNGLLIGDRQRLQSRLTALGFDTGGTDGVIGANTTAAISAFQAQHGLAVTGVPSLDLLALLG